MTQFSITQQCEEVEREIAMRKSAYPRWVAARKMRQSVADFHMERMQAVLETLRSLQDKQ